MKFRNPFAFSRPAEFAYSGPVTSAVNLLGESVEAPKVQIRLDDGLVGEIAKERVEIWYHRPFSRNILTPTFIGKFVDSAEGTVLIGRFVVHKYVKACFASAMFGVVANWIYLAIRDREVIGAQSGILPLVCCLGNIVLALLMLYACAPLFSAEAKVMEDRIRVILAGGVSNVMSPHSSNDFASPSMRERKT